MGLQNTDNWQTLTVFNKENMQYNVIADISYLILQKKFKRLQTSLFVCKIYLCSKIAFGSAVDCCWWSSIVESKWDFVKLTNLMGNPNVCNHIKHWGQHWLLKWFYWDSHGFFSFLYILLHFLQSYNSMGMTTFFFFFKFSSKYLAFAAVETLLQTGTHKCTQTKR